MIFFLEILLLLLSPATLVAYPQPMQKRSLLAVRLSAQLLPMRKKEKIPFSLKLHPKQIRSAKQSTCSAKAENFTYTWWRSGTAKPLPQADKYFFLSCSTRRLQ